MLCYCDYEQPSFYRAVERTAAKPHRCCECGGTIQSGEKYEYVSGKWDGRPGSFHTCEACAYLRDSLAADSVCFQHGGLFEEYYEYLHSILQHIDDVREVYNRVVAKHRAGSGSTGKGS